MQYNMNRQAQIDKIMCKPGYTWNETLGRCLGGYGGGGNDVPTLPDTPETPVKTPTDAIKQEKTKRVKGNGKAAPSAPPMKAVK